MTSNYFFDVSPLYRDLGCPSQCMGNNEYSTVMNIYSFDTDPITPLLSVPQITIGSETQAPTKFSGVSQYSGYKTQYGAPTGFATDVKQGTFMTKPVTTYQQQNGPRQVMLQNVGTRYVVDGQIGRTAGGQGINV